MIERDWVPPDERYKGPTWWDLPGRMLNPRLGRSFIGVWNETWEWKVERGAKRNIVEHLCTGFIISSTTENGHLIDIDCVVIIVQCFFTF